jgi:AraC-like DNA-binding protein
VDTTLFQNSLIKIGHFIISPENPEFHRSGLIEKPLIVFPKNTILIKHQNKDPFVADTSLINLYNKHQKYKRYSINGKGDDCFWIELSNELLQQAQPNCSKDIFNFQNIYCDSATFLMHTQIFKEILNKSIQPLFIDELVIDFLININRTSNIKRKLCFSRPSHLKLVERIKVCIHNNLDQNKSLNSIASDVYSSPFHISRVFKQITGIGLHQYRNQIRLNSVYSKIQYGESDLANLAFTHGFSSHSHLSSGFKKYFGFSPSSLMY